MKSPERIAAEREMAIGLPLIAKHNPKGYASLMRLLARLVVKSRRRRTASRAAGAGVRSAKRKGR